MRIIVILGLFLLVGCVNSPKYIDSTQKVSLCDIAPIGGIKAIYNGKEYHSCDIIPIEREFRDQQIIIQKQGFKDYSYKLVSEWTDEDWATEGSAATLLLPLNTIEYLGQFITGIGMTFTGEYQGLAMIMSGAIVTIPEFVGDVYNIVIGLPSTAIINPWRKYKYQKEKVVLIAQEDQIKLCHAQKNTFMTNIGCLECDYFVDMLSTKEECEYCKNRVWFSDSNLCVLKK